MTIAHRLRFSFCMVLLTMFAVSGVLAWALIDSHQAKLRISKAYEQALQINVIHTLICRELKELSDMVACSAQTAAVPEEISSSRLQIHAAFNRWEMLIANEVELVDDDEREEEFMEMATLANLRSHYERVHQAGLGIVNQIQQGQRDQALLQLESVIEPVYNHQIDNQMVDIIEDEQEEITETLAELSQQHRHIAMVALALTGISLVYTILSSIRLSRSIVHPLKKLQGAAQQLGQNLSAVDIDIPSHDEIGQLARAFEDMAQHLRKSSISVQDLEAEIQKREAAQEAQTKTNKELKEFAYVVSHDLKAPLRGIHTLVDWICKDYQDKLDDTGREHLRLLATRVRRMRDLINGVMQYSRISRTEEEAEHINLNELVLETMDLLSPPSHIDITIETELPHTEWEPTPITQIFQNLISNAIKYMDKDEGMVRINCLDEGDSWQFSVSDNGPGIEEKYFEQIFRVFQTLVSKDRYESTGIGLAVVKKCVDKYGGRIWVTSQVGEGTTFHFTLPKEPNRQSDRNTAINQTAPA